MNWFEHLEKKRTLLVGGTITLCVAILAVTARRNVFSFDSYWHLQTGLDWINHGLSPWVDHFSFTFENQKIVGPPFIFQGLIASLVDKYGIYPGFQIYRFGSYLLATTLATLFLKKLRSPVFVYMLVLPMIVFLMQLRAITRPELISYSFSIIAIMLYHRSRGRISAGNLIPISALMLLWANYHTPILGYVIFLGFFIDAAILQFRENTPLSNWCKWLAWGMVIFGIGFLNHDFSHALIEQLSFSPEWKELIQEYQSPALYRERAAIYVLIGLTFVTLVLSICRQKFGYFVVMMVLVVNSSSMARLVTPSGVIIMCIFASVISEIDLKKKLQEIPDYFNKGIAIVVMLMFVLTLGTSVTLARNFMKENRVSSVLFPESIVYYMLDQNIAGRIFNEYGLGGYLIYNLSQDSKVYIDGRTNILYPVQHYQQYLKARNSSKDLRIEVEKYDIDLIILRSDPRSFKVVYGTDDFGLDYSDGTYSLFSRNNPQFGTSGKLLANPACWNEDTIADLQVEKISAIMTLPSDSVLHPFQKLVIDYSIAGDKVDFLSNIEEKLPDSAFFLRFAAYQALSNGLYQLSFDLLEKIEVWDIKEFLAAIVANIELEDWEKAEQLVDSLSRIAWPDVGEAEIVLLYRTLETINRNSPLTVVPQEYLNNIREQAAKFNESDSNLKLDFSMFCVH